MFIVVLGFSVCLGFSFKGLSWIPISGDSILPSNAVVAGQDVDGTTIYVGRAYHEGIECTLEIKEN